MIHTITIYTYDGNYDKQRLFIKGVTTYPNPNPNPPPQGKNKDMIPEKRREIKQRLTVSD